jgi:hypothetical protein
MENTTALPTMDERQTERRKENKPIAFQNRRVNEWRRAADRKEREGLPVSAMMFRNEAFMVENEQL